MTSNKFRTPDTVRFSDTRSCSWLWADTEYRKAPPPPLFIHDREGHRVPIVPPSPYPGRRQALSSFGRSFHAWFRSFFQPFGNSDYRKGRITTRSRFRLRPFAAANMALLTVIIWENLWVLIRCLRGFKASSSDVRCLLLLAPKSVWTRCFCQLLSRPTSTSGRSFRKLLSMPPQLTPPSPEIVLIQSYIQFLLHQKWIPWCRLVLNLLIWHSVEIKRHTSARIVTLAPERWGQVWTPRTLLPEIPRYEDRDHWTIWMVAQMTKKIFVSHPINLRSAHWHPETDWRMATSMCA